MQQMRLYDTLSVDFPDDMKLMSRAELDTYFGRNRDRYGFINKEDHMILTWTRQKGLLSFLTDARSVVNGAYQTMKHNLPEFQKEAETEMTVAGQKACGYRFQFKAKNKDIYQTGNVMAFKYQGAVYACVFYTHTELYQKNYPIYEDVLRSAQF